MTIGVRTFRGERLKEARLARGLFKNSLADMIGVSGTAITRYEERKDNPQPEKLAGLARSLNFPVEFFERPEWPEKLEPVYWRFRTVETKNAREMTEQRMRWLCEIFAFLDEEVDFPPLNLPHLPPPDDFRSITPEATERAAADARHYWKLRSLPVPDMTLALENAGIPVVNLEILSDKQDGFCFRSTVLDRFFVGVNTYNISAARARFDLAHEFGHILLHRNVSAQQSRDPSFHKVLEQQAHRFAGAFLFPKESFLAEIEIPSLDYFSAKKKRWGMSIAAMIFRAYNLGIIDDTERATLYQNMTRRKWRGPLREPFDTPYEMPLERPRMLRRGLETVLEAGIFGRESFCAAVALPSREIEQIIGVEEGFLDQGGVSQLLVPLRKGGLRTVDLESGNVLEFPQRPRSERAFKSG